MLFPIFVRLNVNALIVYLALSMDTIKQLQEINELISSSIKEYEVKNFNLARQHIAKAMCLIIDCESVENDAENEILSSIASSMLKILKDQANKASMRIDISQDIDAYSKKQLIGGAEHLLYTYLINKSAFDNCGELTKAWLGKCLEDLVEEGKGYDCYIIMHQFDIVPNASIGFDCFNLTKEIEFLRLCMKRFSELKEQEDHELQGEEAIMYYYLGGAAFSFYQFDSVLDCRYELLSPKEYYYYSLTSKILGKDFEQISEDSLRNIIDDNILANYYKGHIYLLKGMKVEAIEYFRRSLPFTYAERMLNYLVDDIQDITSPKRVFVETESIEGAIYSIFEDYYHYHECLIAMKGYSLVPKISHYFYGNKQQLEDSLKIVEANKLSRYLYSDLKGRSKSLSEDEYNKRVAILNELLVNRDSKVRGAFFDTDKGIKVYQCDAEHQIALTIHEFAFENVDFYAILIYYYYFNKYISEEAVINLSMYVMAIAKLKVKKELYDSLFNASVSLITAVSILSPYCSIAQFKHLCQSSSFKITLGQLKGTNQYSSSTLYEEFKKTIALERLKVKQHIGESEFAIKYRFSSIVEKIHQLDSYFEILSQQS